MKGNSLKFLKMKITTFIPMKSTTRNWKGVLNTGTMEIGSLSVEIFVRNGNSLSLANISLLSLKNTIIIHNLLKKDSSNGIKTRNSSIFY